MQATSIKIVLFFWVTTLMAAGCKNPDKETETSFRIFLDDFAKGYRALELAPLNLNYVENLKQIQPLDSLQNQRTFFNNFKERLQSINPDFLSPLSTAEYETVDFEIALNLERIDLEEHHLNNFGHRVINDRGLYFVPNGKAWYTYFIKRWLGAHISPEDLLEFGKKEVTKVQLAIQEIQEKQGFEKDTLSFYEYLDRRRFMEKNKRKVQAKFEEKKQIVRDELWNSFSRWDLPEVNIASGTNKALAHVPAFYNANEQTFYYNHFGRYYNLRQIDWIYLHEAVPGHHFQLSLEASIRDSIPSYRNQLPWHGYREGWAAYVEEIGDELGCYQSDYDWLGKHEWDLVRSVRVVLDIGMNYLGWSNEKALSYWKANIYDQDKIATREIDRMLKWPVQVHTYKYGAAQILETKSKLQKDKGSRFDPLAFHDEILRNGPFPWEPLKKLISNNLK